MDLINALRLLQISNVDLPLSISVTEQRYNEQQKQTLQRLRMQTRDRQLLQQAIAELKQAKALVEQHLQEINNNSDVYFGSQQQTRRTTTSTSGNHSSSRSSKAKPAPHSGQSASTTRNNSSVSWQSLFQDCKELAWRFHLLLKDLIVNWKRQLVHLYKTSPHRKTILFMHGWLLIVLFLYSLSFLPQSKPARSTDKSDNVGMRGFYIRNYWSTPTPTWGRIGFVVVTPVPTLFLTKTPTGTQSPISTATPTSTQSPTSTLTNTLTVSNSPTFTVTQSPTETDSPTETSSSTFTASPTWTHSPSSTKTNTPIRKVDFMVTQIPTRAPPGIFPIPGFESTVDDKHVFQGRTANPTTTPYNYVNLFYDLFVRNPRKETTLTPTVPFTQTVSPFTTASIAPDTSLRLVRPGKIQIHSTPWSEIKLVREGKVIVDGFAPTEVFTIQPGIYSLSSESDQDLIEISTIEVIPDRFTTIRINLTLQTYSITQGEFP